MRRNPRVALVLAAIALLGAPVASQPDTRVVFVQASNASGPLRSLTPADFTIRENGELREIVSARLASDPMRIVLMVDTSEAAEPALVPMRDALQIFIQALPPQHEIVFITTGRQFRVHVPPTTDREPVAGAISTMFTDTGSGNVLLDSLIEADQRFMRQEEVGWPVFVVITTDGPERSTVTRNEELNAFIQSLSARAATVHAVMLQGRGGGGPSNQVTTGLTDMTGGQYDSLNMNATDGLPETLRKLAAAMAAHHERMSTYYRVEFTSGSSAPQPIEVGVTTDGRAEMDLLFSRRLRR